MILETEFRIAVAYLLLLKLGIAAWAGKGKRQPEASREADDPLSRSLHWLVRGLFLGPFLLLLIEPAWLSFGQFIVPSGPRWLLSVPVVGAVLLLVWAQQSDPRAAVEDSVREPGGEEAAFAEQGPYRWVRFPVEASHAFFYLQLACLAANWAIVLSCLLGVVVLRMGVLPRWEAVGRRKWGTAYDLWVLRTGSLLPPFWHVHERQYTVPKRFGMAAIVGLLTALGIIFGGLKQFNASPAIYLFVASEIVAICISQILLGSAPRSGSCLTGAILLPFWVSLSIEGNPAWLPNEMVVGFYTFLFVFGALLGYCIGAVAAGFFLVMDVMEPFLPGAGRTSRPRFGAEEPAAAVAPPPDTPRSPTTVQNGD